MFRPGCRTLPGRCPGISPSAYDGLASGPPTEVFFIAATLSIRSHRAPLKALGKRLDSMTSSSRARWYRVLDVMAPLSSSHLGRTRQHCGTPFAEPHRERVPRCQGVPWQLCCFPGCAVVPFGQAEPTIGRSAVYEVQEHYPPRHSLPANSRSVGSVPVDTYECQLYQPDSDADTLMKGCLSACWEVQSKTMFLATDLEKRDPAWAKLREKRLLKDLGPRVPAAEQIQKPLMVLLRPENLFGGDFSLTRTNRVPAYVAIYVERTLAASSSSASTSRR